MGKTTWPGQLRTKVLSRPLTCFSPTLRLFRLVPTPVFRLVHLGASQERKPACVKGSYSAQHASESSFTRAVRETCPKDYEGCSCQGEQLGLGQAAWGQDGQISPAEAARGKMMADFAVCRPNAVFWGLSAGVPRSVAQQADFDRMV